MLRVVFMGTPDFSVPTLEGLLAAGHTLVAAYSQPPRPAGRGMAERKSPVHLFAERANIPVLTPRTLRTPDAQSAFTAHAADVAVVVAYGLILPAPVLTAPRHGCLNLHASALPRWRGAAPIQRAVMAGDSVTAASIMRMDEGLDTGPVCLEEQVPIGLDTTAGELHDVLAARGAALMMRALAALERGELRCTPQPGAGATYAPKIGKDETRIDFTRSAVEVHNHIRGLSPVPGAWFEMEIAGRPERIKVLRASRAAGGNGRPGQALDAALTVACGAGAIRIEEVQRAGRRPMPAADFLRGVPIAAQTDLQGPRH